MIKYLGLVLVFSAIYSMIQFRKYRVENFGSHYVPVDILIEFFLGVLMLLPYFVKEMNKYQSIYIQKDKKFLYSNSLQSDLRDYCCK